jgi:hypothetical protein
VHSNTGPNTACTGLLKGPKHEIFGFGVFIHMPENRHFVLFSAVGYSAKRSFNAVGYNAKDFLTL